MVQAAATHSPLASHGQPHMSIHTGVAIAAAQGTSKRMRDAATLTANTLDVAESVIGSGLEAKVLKTTPEDLQRSYKG